MSLVNLILSGWLVVAVLFLFLWLIAVSQRNAGWVDVGWSFSLVLLVCLYAIGTDGTPWRRGLYMLLVAFWGIRLCIHILTRILGDNDEDPRYAHLRRHWGKAANRNFFFFFQSQGLANMLLAAPVLLLMQVERQSLSVFDVLGTLLMAGAVFGESLADRQLKRWKADPENRGKTCRLGLWGLSRHPNYFFEWLQWAGYPVLGGVLFQTGLAYWWPLTLLGPAVMLLLLVRYTGIPYTEKQAIRSRGEDYLKYQREVSAFIPWFPETRRD